MSVTQTPVKTQPRLLIDGEFVDGAGEQIDVFNPASGERITTCGAASAKQVDQAVTAAAEAFGAWRSVSLSRRVKHLHAMKVAVEANADELAELLTVDQGKTIAEARGELLRASEYIEGATAAPMLFKGENVNIAAGIDARRVRESLGVFVAISPFNFPVMNPSMFAAWALACGNTLVLKVSEQDPIVSTRLLEIFNESGLPPGVLNLVHGRVEVAQQLVTHPTVVGISSITSTPAARAIYKSGTAAGKRVQANGGAKNPLVVMPDADLDAAAQELVTSAFGMAGQRCLAASRLVVVGDVHDALIERIGALCDSIVIGDGLNPETTMGPVISAASRERVVEAIGTAVDGGAELIRDGREVSPEGDGTGEGYFVGPTLLGGLDTADATEQQELFGPAVVVHRVGDLDGALQLANDTKFGNAATIFTSSGSAAREFETRCRSGNIGINAFPAPPPNLTMGGYGESFFGDIHMSGKGPIEFYTDHKVVVSRW